jgi:hypothetical protein
MLPSQVPEAMEKLTRHTNELLKNVDARDSQKHALTIATFFSTFFKYHTSI